MTEKDDCGYFDSHNDWSELIQKTLSATKRQWFVELPLTMRMSITRDLRARAMYLVGKMKQAQDLNHSQAVIENEVYQEIIEGDDE